MDVLGIDVSKNDFHACLLQGGRQAAKSFPNGAAGYQQLRRWLNNRRCEHVHACMEATGGYWLSLARVLYEAGLTVSVVNPSRTALFARSQLRRTKTDRVDAEMIAQFCRTQSPSLWTPPAPEILELRGFLTYRDHLVEQRVRLQQLSLQIQVTDELRRMHTEQVTQLKHAIDVIEQQMREFLLQHPVLSASVDCLDGVQGVGFVSAAVLVSELPVQRLRNDKAAAAYVGLAPRERQSGTSIHGRPRICKIGNGRLRKALYMPALAAMRHNPILRQFAERLKAKGKPPKVVVVAVMRKLVVLAYHLLSQLPTPEAA